MLTVKQHTPISTQSQSEKLLLIDQIADVLQNEREILSNFGYTKGLLGSAVFFYNYAKFKDEPVFAQIAESFIEDSLTRLNSNMIKNEKLGKDFAELGMFLEYAQTQDWCEFDNSEIIGYTDSYFAAFANNRLSRGDFDPYTGGLLSGHYFLHRSGEVQRINISVIIKQLEKLAVSDNNNGLYWKSKLFDDDRIYLGLSHGLAAIIVFLCSAIEKDIEIDTCQKLIVGAVNYIQSHQQSVELKGCFFPDIVGEADKGRLGLCYGDMGVIYALYRAGMVLKDEVQKKHAEALMIQTTTRKTVEANGIRDAGILYGASGVALIYDKMYRLTDNSIFDDSANEWYNSIINYQKKTSKHQSNLGFEGFFNQHFAHTNYSFMEGIAGIGTTLMQSIDRSAIFDKLIWLY
ncbi:hypothetical protein GCM10011514_43210 [Emticicia aquatilis]|uniref:Lanthionine synthetase C-like protein n=1 Tax=Emticicia aquatilis TaxID=1537369 RepID=A0A917DVJ0_9BACT|nr:lanthionine synthetase LanC family protein [Emticicia aquatilis]GGD74514.1 hypothetical protein GCM10011514_43210 [Emticicia aquatilis]